MPLNWNQGKAGNPGGISGHPVSMPLNWNQGKAGSLMETRRRLVSMPLNWNQGKAGRRTRIWLGCGDLLFNESWVKRY